MINRVHLSPNRSRAWLIGQSERRGWVFFGMRENFLPFFTGGALYLASGASATVGIVYFGIFLLARYGHTYAYLKQKARLRRDAFTAGWSVNIVMSLHAVWAILTKTFA